MRKLRVVIGLFLGAVLLSSCSLIPQSKGPVTVAKEKVPFGLLDKNIPEKKRSPSAFSTKTSQEQILPCNSLALLCT